MQQKDIDIVYRAKLNPQVFQELYLKYADKIYNYFWYRTGHQKDIAEDLMQETFARAFRHLPKFRIRGYSYLVYLMTIAHNLLVNYYRSRKLIPLEEIGDVPVEITNTVDRKIEAEKLWKAVHGLSTIERDAILMRYQKEMPIKEIARVMGKTENAVKLLLSRTRKKLAEHPYIKDMVEFRDQPRSYMKPKFLNDYYKTF